MCSRTLALVGNVFICSLRLVAERVLGWLALQRRYKRCCRPRMVLLIYLMVSLGGTFTIEQPANSTMEYYPRLRELFRRLVEIAGDQAVTWRTLLLLPCLPHAHSKRYRCLSPRSLGDAGGLVDEELWSRNSKTPLADLKRSTSSDASCWKTCSG